MTASLQMLLAAQGDDWFTLPRLFCLIDRVVDVSSSIWLLDLARDHPKATLEGFDISSAQYPHPGWLPDNVHLNILDILRPIPADLRGKFDIVHVGLVVLVVENGNPSALLENLLTMLSMPTPAASKVQSC